MSEKPTEPMQPNWKEVSEQLAHAEQFPIPAEEAHALSGLARHIRINSEKSSPRRGVTVWKDVYRFASEGEFEKREEIINPALGKRLKKYRPIYGPMEPEFSTETLHASYPELRSLLDKLDISEQKGDKKQAKQQRDELDDALLKAHEDGVLAERDVFRAEAALQKEKPVIRAEREDLRKQLREKMDTHYRKERDSLLSFEDYVAGIDVTRNDLNMTNETKNKLMSRWLIARDIGLFKSLQDQTKGSNRYKDIFDTLKNDEDWEQRIAPGIAARFVAEQSHSLTFSDSRPEAIVRRTEQIEDRVRTYLLFPELGTVDAADFDQLRTVVDNDGEWAVFIRRLQNKFEHTVDTLDESRKPKGWPTTWRDTIKKHFRIMRDRKEFRQVLTSNLNELATRLGDNNYLLRDVETAEEQVVYNDRFEEKPGLLKRRRMGQNARAITIHQTVTRNMSLREYLGYAASRRPEEPVMVPYRYS